MATRLPSCFAAAAAAAAVAAAASPNPRSKKKGSSSSGSATARLQAEARRQGLRGPAATAWESSTGDAVLTAGSTMRSSVLGALEAVRIGRVAHADAAAAPDLAGGSEDRGEEASSVALGDGEKPEFIQRADEQAEEMRTRLRRPAQFPDQFGEVSQLTAVHSFEGFRLEVAKVVTPTFFTQQSIIFGNPQVPGGQYQGHLTVVGENDMQVRASSDAELNVSLDASAPLGMPGLIGKLSVHQGKNEVLQGTALYMGETWCGQVSAGSGPVDISYNQAVTEQLSVGGQGQFSAAQQAVGLLYGFKYNTPSWTVLGRLIGGGANVVTAQYLRRVVPGRVTLGAEYQAQLGAGSQMMVGAEFVLRQSKVSASVDCNGKVDSTLELKCGTFPTLPVTLTISSSLDHAEDKHVFGLALTCGN